MTITIKWPEGWEYEQRERAFMRQCQLGSDIFAEKNRQYGDAIRFGGAIGAVMELIGCVARLQTLVVLNDGPYDLEAIYNALRDAHNYANIATMLVTDDNWKGEQLCEPKK
jgi:hypothetical protein